MSFQFSFNSSDSNAKKIQENINVSPTKAPAEIITLSSSPIVFNGEQKTIGPVSLIKRSFHDIKFELAQNDVPVTHFAFGAKDVDKGIYEGGLKTWECALDLVLYLHSIKDKLKNKHIMELGCGSALPGIYAKSIGAHVDFQDYNQQTGPNVVANEMLQVEMVVEADLTLQTESVFYAGDWSLLQHLMPRKYDIVLTSETIYESNNISSLMQLMKKILIAGGCAYVAAKTHYFGCSGGIEQFRRECEAEGCTVEVVYVHGDTVRREILKVMFDEVEL